MVSRSREIELAVCVFLKVESSGGELFPIRRGLTSTLIIFCIFEDIDKVPSEAVSC